MAYALAVNVIRCGVSVRRTVYVSWRTDGVKEVRQEGKVVPVLTQLNTMP
jgi:hypothetical protein